MMKYFGWQFNSEKRDYLFFIKGVSINDYNLNNIDNSEGINFVRNVILNNDEIPLVQKIVDDLLQLLHIFILIVERRNHSLS